MNRAETLKKIAENELRVFSAGYEQGKQSAITSSPFYLIGNLQGTFQNLVFPENYEMVLRIKRTPSSTSNMFANSTNIKSVKLIADKIKDTDSIGVSKMFQYNKSIKTVDLTQWCRKFNGAISNFMESTLIKRIIGALDFSSVTGTYMAFANSSSLEEIEFVPNSIKISLQFKHSKLLNKTSITSIVNGLDNEITGQTLSLSKTAVDNAFETSAGAADGSTSQEWLDLIATKTNWTITLA